jgi:hypothetical protein
MSRRCEKTVVTFNACSETSFISRTCNHNFFTIWALYTILPDLTWVYFALTRLEYSQVLLIVKIVWFQGEKEHYFAGNHEFFTRFPQVTTFFSQKYKIKVFSIIFSEFYLPFFLPVTWKNPSKSNNPWKTLWKELQPVTTIFSLYL